MRYKYDRLNERREQFRLLRLDDGHDTTITGQLITTEFDVAPPFFALSYCWGKQVALKSIICDGQTIRITRGLQAALHRLRVLSHESTAWDLSPRYFWIDQICVNQHDSDERSSQVKLMKSVYSQAMRTVVWLGNSHGTSTASLKLNDQIYEVFHREYPNATESMDIEWHPFEEDLHDSTGLPSMEEDCWHHFAKFYALPWFKRIWVVQEIASSRNEPLLLVDEKIYGWDRFAWAASFLQRRSYANALESPMEILNVDIIADIRRSLVPWSLSALLAESSNLFDASDSRDKIYALLGLAAETKGHTWPKELEPDYRKETSIVFREVARYLFQQSNNLALLSFPPAPWVSGLRWPWRPAKLPNIPSWVPDWAPQSLMEPRLTPELAAETTAMNTGLASVELHYLKAHKASAGRKPVFACVDNSKSLALHGVQLGQVTVCSGVNFELGAWLQYDLRTIYQWPWKYLIFDIGWIANGQWDVGFSYALLIVRSAFLVPWILEAWRSVKIHMRDQSPRRVAEDFVHATTIFSMKSGRLRNDNIDDNQYVALPALATCILKLSKFFDPISITPGRRLLLPLVRLGIPVGRLWRTWNPKDKFDSFLQEELKNSIHEHHKGLEYYMDAKGLSRARRLFVLKEQQCIGIGPAAMKQGDVACVLFGGEVPFILRQEGDTFRLIGDCYIPQFHNGEAIHKLEAGEIDEKVFEIR